MTYLSLEKHNNKHYIRAIFEDHTFIDGYKTIDDLVICKVDETLEKLKEKFETLEGRYIEEFLEDETILEGCKSYLIDRIKYHLAKLYDDKMLGISRYEIESWKAWDFYSQIASDDDSEFLHQFNDLLHEKAQKHRQLIIDLIIVEKNLRDSVDNIETLDDVFRFEINPTNKEADKIKNINKKVNSKVSENVLK